MRPFDNQPAFAPFYAPGFWLLAIGLAVVIVARAPLGRVAKEALTGAWRACAVTLAFVVMAEFYVGSGMAAAIAEALRGVAGRGAALGVPLFAAVGGFPHGSGAAANAMLMPMEIALAAPSPSIPPGSPPSRTASRRTSPCCRDPRLDGRGDPRPLDLRRRPLPPRLAARLCRRC